MQLGKVQDARKEVESLNARNTKLEASLSAEKRSTTNLRELVNMFNKQGAGRQKDLEQQVDTLIWRKNELVSSLKCSKEEIECLKKDAESLKKSGRVIVLELLVEKMPRNRQYQTFCTITRCRAVAYEERYTRICRAVLDNRSLSRRKKHDSYSKTKHLIPSKVGPSSKPEFHGDGQIASVMVSPGSDLDRSYATGEERKRKNEAADTDRLTKASQA